MKRWTMWLAAALAVGCGCAAVKSEKALEGRTWILHRPQDRPCAAVVMLHGYGGKAEGYCPQMTAAATNRGFAVCVPEALVDGKGKRSWNVGYPSQREMAVDDTAFLDALANRLRRELGVRHVFLTGMSNGGEMCYQMAYRSPKSFDAIASVSGLTLTCLADGGAPIGGVPFMELHGASDTTSPWEGDLGNANKYWGAFFPVTNAVERIVAANGGDIAKFSERRLAKAVTCRTWAGRCETRLYRVEKGPHSWFFGFFDSANEILDFFRDNAGL